jgi:hypothetical protein
MPNPQRKIKDTSAHDVATGALEGGILGPVTEPLYSKLGGKGWGESVLGGGPKTFKTRGGFKSLGKASLIGAGLGAASTALIGAGVHAIAKKREEEQEMSSKSRIIRFAKSGEIHERYAPNSIYNTTKGGQEIKKAVLNRKTTDFVTTGRGRKLFTTTTSPSGRKERIPRTIGSTGFSKGGVRAFIRAKYNLSGAAAKLKGDIDKMAIDYSRSGSTPEQIKEVSKTMRRKHIAHYTKELRGNMKAPEKVKPEMQAHRDVMAGELHESRRIIQAEKQHRTGVKTKPLSPAKMQEIKSRPIQGKTHKASGQPLMDRDTLHTHRQNLDAAALTEHTRAQTALERVHAKLKTKIGAGLERLGLIEKHQRATSVESLMDPLKMTGSTPTKTQKKLIAEPLTHGYIPTGRHPLDYEIRKSPRRIGIGHVNKIISRVLGMQNAATGGLAGERMVKDKILKKGTIFDKPLPKAAPPEPAGYPHLRKVGIGLGGAALLTGGIIAGKKLLDRRKEKQHEFSSGSKKLRTLLQETEEAGGAKVIKHLTETGALEYATEGGETYKNKFENELKRSHDLNKELTDLHAKREHVAGQKKFKGSVEARSEGFKEGRKASLKEHLASQEASRLHHETEIKASRGERDAAKRTASRIIPTAIGAGAIGGAGGYLIGRKPKETQFSADPMAIRSNNKNVTKDKYGKLIKTNEANRRDSNYGRSALTGGALGAVLRAKMKIVKPGRAALIGAGSGIAVEAATRIANRNNRDQFGEKTIGAKRIEAAPWQGGAAAAAVMGARKLYKESPVVQRTVRKYFSAIEFDQQDDDERRASYQKAASRYIYGKPRAVYPKAEKFKRYLGRGSRLIESAKSHVSGKPNLDARGREKTPEWKKPWVIGGLATTAIAGGVLAHHGVKKIIREAPHNSNLGQLRESFLQGHPTDAMRKTFPATSKVADFITGVKSDIGKLMNKAAAPMTKVIGEAAGKPGEVPTSKETLKRHKQAATEKENKDIAETLHQKGQIISGPRKGKGLFPEDTHKFAVHNPDWDVRDQRGNSARVYAPGHQIRERRPKEWYERQGVQRTALAIAGIGAPVGAYVAHRKGMFKGMGKAVRRDVDRSIHKIRPAKGTPFGIVDPIEASSKTKLIHFQSDDHAKRNSILTGSVGALAGSQYIGGRAPYPNEDLTGKRIIRRHRVIPIAQHEGIGIGHDTIAEVHHRGILGGGKIRATKISSFNKRGDARVADEVGNMTAAHRAKTQIGKPFRYNLLTSNCQDFTDYARRVTRPLSRQTRRAIAGGGLAAAAGYAASKISSRKEMSSRSRLIQFKEKKNDHKALRTAAIAGGVGAAAVGAALLPGASSLMKIQGREVMSGLKGKLSTTKGLRSFINPPKADPNRGGRMVADYIDASQKFLNQGVHGKVLGAALGHAKRNPEGPVSKAIQKIPGSKGDFGISHYARFRAGHREALNHWDWEVGEMIKKRPAVSTLWGSKKPKGVSKEAHIASEHETLRTGREKTHAAINEQLWTKGLNEQDAIRHVATRTEDPEIRGYFNKLAITKSGAAKGYAKKALLSPGLIAGGGATAVAGATVNRDRKKRIIS